MPCPPVTRTCSCPVLLLHAPLHAPSYSVHVFVLGPVLLLHAPVRALSCSPVTRTSACPVLFCCYTHLFMFGPVLLFHPSLLARSFSPVTCTSSCSALFPCYIHPIMLRPVLFLPRLHAPPCSPVTPVHARSCSVNAPLHTQSCSPVPSKSSCSVLFSCYMHLFLLGPVILLDVSFIPSTTAVSHCASHSIHTTCSIYTD